MEKPSARKIALIQSRWHADIVDRAREGFVARLAEPGIAAPRVDCFQVPGAFEIPLKAKQLLGTGDYALVVAAGLVVDGGIYRHEFVAQAVISGLMQVQLETGLPVLSVVLTPRETFRDEAHHDFYFDHMLTKGREAADAAVELLQLRGSKLEARA